MKEQEREEQGITSAQIRIQGGPVLLVLKELEYTISPNEHARATITGTKKSEESWKEEHALLSDSHEVVTISFLTEQGEQPAFSGYLERVQIKRETKIALVTMHLVSGTILLDQRKESRSYQDTSLSYAELVQEAIRGTKQASCLCTIGKEVFPKKPHIQYRETAWEFALRLASHVKGVLYPESTYPLPRFYFGVPQEREQKEEKAEEYTAGVSERYYELGGEESGNAPYQFVYYEIETKRDFSLSTGIQWKGRTWRIGKKTARLVREEVRFTYTLCHPILVSLKQRYSPLFAGRSLTGTVLAVEGERIKLHLDREEKQEKKKAYAYPWTPDTGSILYCMPKAGTRVSLYFAEEDEQSGSVISCIREKGASSAALLDPEKRGLTTEQGKKLFFYPEEMGVLAEETGNYLKLEDRKGVQLTSGKSIVIEAEGTIRLRGKQVTIETPVEIRFTRG